MRESADDQRLEDFEDQDDTQRPGEKSQIVRRNFCIGDEIMSAFRVTSNIHVLNTWWSIASLALCVGIGTPSHTQAIQPVPPTPINIKKVELGGTPWNPQWDQIIEKALPPEMLSSQVPQGVRRFCPQFYEMGTAAKRTFWAYFFQALAGAEAGLNPITSVRHSDPEGAPAMRSEGLLQLAYADHKRYGCDFNWQADRALKANDPAKTIL